MTTIKRQGYSEIKGRSQNTRHHHSMVYQLLDPFYSIRTQFDITHEPLNTPSHPQSAQNIQTMLCTRCNHLCTPAALLSNAHRKLCNAGCTNDFHVGNLHADVLENPVAEATGHK